MHFIILGKPTRLKSGDRAVVTVESNVIPFSTVRFFRGDRQLVKHNIHRDKMEHEYTIDANIPDRISSIMCLVATVAGLSVSNTSKPATNTIKGSEFIFVFKEINFENKISERCLASYPEKVRFRVGKILDNIDEKRKKTPTNTNGYRWLYSIKYAFELLAENPEAEEGSGMYKGWNSDDIRLLYFILYGEELEVKTEKV